MVLDEVRALRLRAAIKWKVNLGNGAFGIRPEDSICLYAKGWCGLLLDGGYDR